MKVLFVGLGSIGQRHLRNLRAILGEEVEFLALRTLRRSFVLNDRMELVPGADLPVFHRVREFAGLEEALSARPDVVFITNPTRLHVPLALEAARQGCHLFIEKPLADTAQGVNELLEIVAARDLVAYVGFQLRFHPCLQTVKQWLVEGRIGTPLSARLQTGEYLPNWHPYEDYRQGYAARRDLGGGALATQSHEFDYLSWFFGTPSRVFALGGHLSQLEVDAEDLASVLLEYRPHGRLLPVHLHLDYLQWPPAREGMILGERGKISWDLLENRVILRERITGKVETCEYLEFPRNQLFLDQLRHFLACMRREAEPLVGLREGLENILVIEAARQSLETGNPVTLKRD